MTRTRISVLAGIAVIAAATAAPALATSFASADPGYSWYQSMMAANSAATWAAGAMMGGSSYGRMSSPAGYRWMTGGTGAPGWKNGGSLPSSMMGTSTDPVPCPRPRPRRHDRHLHRPLSPLRGQVRRPVPE